MEFEGTVYKIMPVTKGTSARGEWQRQDVVFEMNEGSFTRKIWYTDIRAWRLQPKQESAGAGAPMPDMPPIAEEPSYASSPAQVDDLPF